MVEMGSVQPPSTWHPTRAPLTTPKGIAHNLPSPRDAAAPAPPPRMPPKIDHSIQEFSSVRPTLGCCSPCL